MTPLFHSSTRRTSQSRQRGATVDQFIKLRFNTTGYLYARLLGLFPFPPAGCASGHDSMKAPFKKPSAANYLTHLKRRDRRIVL